MRLRLTLAAIAGVAVACTSSDRGTTPAGDTGGTLLIALPSEPATLLPTIVAQTSEKQIVDQLFDYLAEPGPDLNTIGDAGFTPRLAESWQWANDSLSIAFRLHPQARWHDGRPVTSRDVRFTVELIKDPKAVARATAAIADVDSVSTPDSLTAVIWFSRRSPEQFYNVVYNVVPVPEHLLRDADRANLAAHPFARSPVGSGPFRFARWEARTVVEVTADTTHYLARPLLDRVIWMLNPDITAALVNVIAGDIDALEIVTPDGMKRLAEQNLVQAVPYPNPNYGYLGFNLRDQRNPSRPHPLFGDRNLRRALVMSIDRRTLLKNVYDTLADLGSGPFSRMIATADTALAMPAFDSSGADRLLDSLGWRDQNGDGVREKGGRPLRFGLMTPAQSAGRRRYAELIQAQLRSHGVQVDVEIIDGPAMTPRMQAGKFDAFLNSLLAEPSPSAVRDNWHSMPAANRGSNYQLYGNPAVDAAIDSALIETDPARGRALYRKAYQGILDDAAGIWLYENRSYMALHGRVQPVMKGADSWWRFLRLWSIPAANRLPRDAR